MTKCSRCHRALRSEKSQAAGIGPTCARRKAAEARFTAEQQAKARRAIAAHALAPTDIRTARGRRVFAITSSDGTATYFATKGACTCPAGEHEKLCYHRLAIALVA